MSDSESIDSGSSAHSVQASVSKGQRHLDTRRPFDPGQATADLACKMGDVAASQRCAVVYGQG